MQFKKAISTELREYTTINIITKQGPYVQIYNTSAGATQTQHKNNNIEAATLKLAKMKI